MRAIRSQIPSGTRILYGGSVNPKNAAEILALPEVDGALVGGASLEGRGFLGDRRGLSLSEPPDEMSRPATACSQPPAEAPT